MLPDEIRNIILNIEKKYSVSSWKIDDVEIWPLIRISNYAILSEQAFGNSNSSSKSIRIKQLIKGMVLSFLNPIRDFRNNQRIKKPNFLFLSDGVSFSKLSNKYYDKFCDPLIGMIKNLGFSSQIYTLGNSYYIPRFSSSKFIQRQINLNILYARFRKKTNVKKISLVQYQNFLKDPELSKLPYKPSIHELVARVKKIQRLKQYFTRQMKEISPMAAFIVSYYHDAGFAFILACRIRNIKVIDIQHGVQGEYHLSYGSWSKVPSKGFDQLPDEFWVWSDEEAKTINYWSENCSNHQAVNVGNIFLDLWKNPPKNSFLKEYILKAHSIFSANKNTILLTLSPGVVNEEMLGDTFKFIHSTQYKYNWLVRLHPNMIKDIAKWKDHIKKLGIINFNINEATHYPLYAILKIVDLHITAQSSTVLESYALNVPSMITAKFGYILFKKQIPTKYLFYARDLDKMRLVSEQVLAKKPNYTTKDSKMTETLKREVVRLTEAYV